MFLHEKAMFSLNLCVKYRNFLQCFLNSTKADKINFTAKLLFGQSFSCYEMYTLFKICTYFLLDERNKLLYEKKNNAKN